MSRKTKLYSLGVSATAVLVATGYLLYLNFVVVPSRNETVDTSQSQSVKEATKSDTVDINETAATYTISDVSKKEGDTFSVPDIVSFKISPEVTESRILLVTEDGTTIYEKMITGSEVSQEVYPERKLSAGAAGTIVIEGIVSKKVVAKKEIGVLF